MTELDKALNDYLNNEENHASFYDLVLNSNFYVPVHDDAEAEGEKEIDQETDIEPLIFEAEGQDYLMLFENEERLMAWADEAVSYVVIPGHVIAQMSPPELYWALNVGTDYQKQFVPEEIKWLKEVVENCSANTEPHVD